MQAAVRQYRVISSKQSGSIYTLYQTLTKLERDYHDTKLGPKMVLADSGTNRFVHDIKDFTTIRHTLNNIGHSGMLLDPALKSLRGMVPTIQQRLQDEEKKPLQNNRWGLTRMNIINSSKPVEEGKQLIKELFSLTKSISPQLQTAITALDTGPFETRSEAGIVNEGVMEKKAGDPVFETPVYKPWER